MTGGRQAARRPERTPLSRRTRRRWAIAAAVAACWVFLAVVAGSVLSATIALVVIVTLAAAAAAGLRVLGITSDHPWIRRLASRPWRDGQDVLRVAVRHMSEVFVVTPSGALLAPNVVELALNPGDLGSLCERMELGVISESMTEVYEEQVNAWGVPRGGSRARGTRHRRRGRPAGPLPAAAGRSRGPLGDGDTIRWGAGRDAPLSRVEIG